VEAERDLAEPAGALVHVQERLEVLEPAGSLGRYHLAAFEAQPDVLDLAAAEERGEGEADLALGHGLERARIHLAVGHVVAPVRGLPRPTLDAEPEIGVRPHDADLARLAESICAAAQLGPYAVPVPDRILGALDVARPEDEVLVLLERHLRVLRVRGGREDDSAP